MLDRPARPSRAVAAFNQAAMPAMINAAGTLERQLEELAQRTRRSPLMALGVAVGLGWVLRWLLRPSRA